MTNWIPTTDRLPQKHAWVLAYDGRNADVLGFTPGKGFEHWVPGKAEVSNLDIENIMHWERVEPPDDPDTSGGAFWRGRETETDGGG